MPSTNPSGYGYLLRWGKLYLKIEFTALALGLPILGTLAQLDGWLLHDLPFVALGVAASAAAPWSWRLAREL